MISFVVVVRRRGDVTHLYNGLPIAGPWWVDWLDDADTWYAREVERMRERAPA